MNGPTPVHIRGLRVFSEGYMNLGGKSAGGRGRVGGQRVGLDLIKHIICLHEILKC